MKLFMLLLGCKPPSRNTEQHDVFFGIAANLAGLVPAVYRAWPEAAGKIHIDAWREISKVDGYRVRVYPREERKPVSGEPLPKLFFINLGGYKPNEFEEFHYKLVAACESKTVAIRYAKQTAFYKHTGMTGAPSHIDDTYGVDVDDIFEIEDILPEEFKDRFGLELLPDAGGKTDQLNLGYLKLEKLQEGSL